jgi:hypothetical protein
MLARYTQVDYDRELALVAGLGFKSTPDPNDREQVIATLELPGVRVRSPRDAH